MMRNLICGHVSFVWCNFGDPFEIHGKLVTKNHETASKLAREYSKIRGPAPHRGGGLRPPPRWGVAVGSGSFSGEFYVSLRPSGGTSEEAGTLN